MKWLRSGKDYVIAYERVYMETRGRFVREGRVDFIFARSKANNE